MSAVNSQIRGKTPADFFKPIDSAMQAQQGAIANAASGQPQQQPGYFLKEWRKSMFGGYPVYQWGLSPEQQAQVQSQQAASDPRNLQASLFSGMVGAAQTDTENLQRAADEQFQRQSDAAAGFKSFLGTIDGRIASARDAALGQLGGAADIALRAGQDVISRFDARAKGILPELDKGIERSRLLGQDAVKYAKEYGGQAITAAQGAAAGFQGGYNEQIASATAGLERRAVNDMREFEAMAQSGQYSRAEIEAMRRERSFDLTQQVGAVKADLGMRYQETKAQLDMAVAQVTAGVGENVTRAALEEGRLNESLTGLRAQVATALTGQGLEAERIKQGYTQLYASLKESMGNIQNASALAAVQALMQGNTAYYEMIQSNPKSVVSILAGLAQIASFATAPGGPAYVNQGGGGGGVSFGGGGGGFRVGQAPNNAFNPMGQMMNLGGPSQVGNSSIGQGSYIDSPRGESSTMTRARNAVDRMGGGGLI